MAMSGAGRSAFYDLYGAETLLALPTLFDLLVHAAPDTVLGDGGSLYLKVPPPESQRERNCPGCMHPFKPGKPNAACEERAYLMATTRDYPRAQIAGGFYCTNSKRYEEAGECIRTLLVGPMNRLNRCLIRSLLCAMREWPKSTRASVNDPLSLYEERARSFFRFYFCPGETGRSRATRAVRRSLNLADEACSPSAFDLDAETLADAMEAGATPEAGSACPGRSLEMLYRCSAALGQEAATGRPRHQAGQDRMSATLENINVIVWELLQCHELLRDQLAGYQAGLLSIRTRFPALGLSGWSAAFGAPIRLRNIENPFEVHAANQLRVKELRSSGALGRAGLPIPVWGDRARGHKDRLERQGRPFLVVPVPSDPDHPGAGSAGFLRIATKREGERRFTADDERALVRYAGHVARLVREIGAVDEPSKAEETKLRRWWIHRIYGAVKGQSLAQIGPTAARAFRESFRATVASVFLREDLWLPHETADLAARATAPEGVSSGGPGRKYTLWGTDVDPEFFTEPEVEPEAQAQRRAQFTEFEAAVGQERYAEGEGKTGWALKYRTPVLAEYAEGPWGERVVVHISRTQWVEASKTKRTNNWVSTPSGGAFSQDPREIEKLVDQFRTKDPVAGHKREMRSRWHSRFLIVPLIDPDSSPEPLGAIRLIFSTSAATVAGTQLSRADLMTQASRLARSLARLLRSGLQRHRLLRTLSELVGSCTQPDKLIDRSATSDAVETAGDYGREAASLLTLGEASAVSIFVRNDCAPRAYQVFPPGDESWALVGAAADRDAMTEADLGQFRSFCEAYLKNAKGACRYRAGQGRTGHAIAEGRALEFEIAAGEETQRSAHLYEVRSPNAVLVIPARKLGRPGHDVVAAVRFVRTEERRRAKFLAEEKERLDTVVEALGWLVPARSRQDEYTEFRNAWKDELDKVLPLRLRDMLQQEILSEPGLMDSDKSTIEGREAQLDRLAGNVEAWVIQQDTSDSSSGTPRSRSGVEVRKAEVSLLAWFLRTLERPSTEMRLADLVRNVVRGLLRIQWGPELADPWAESLKRLGRFEPLLSEIPLYRDHTIHQFQVFLLGWILIRRLERLNVIGFSDEGWNAIAPGDLPEAGEAGPREAPPGPTPTEFAAPVPDGRVRIPVSPKEWGLASLFHDVAYPLERAHRWANVFGEALTDVRGEYVAKGDARRFFGPGAKGICRWEDASEVNAASKGGVAPFDAPLGQLFAALTRMLPPPAGATASAWNEKLGRAIGSCLCEWDHGLWASLVLLERSEPTPAIVSAAVAIALHGKLLRFLWSEQIRICLESPEELDRSNPLPQRRALTFLLLMTDALHEWGRDVRDDDRGGLEEIGRRPSLVKFDITGTQPDGTYSPDGDRERPYCGISVDLAMGRGCRLADLMKKTDELTRLGAVLASRGVVVTIRVGRGDPGVLDHDAVRTRQVIIGCPASGPDEALDFKPDERSNK